MLDRFDFTLSSYLSLLDAAREGAYRPCAVVDWFDGACAGDSRVLVIRHDVDRRPGNALDMARAEAERGVRSTYYFRSVPESFQPGIITAIAGLGHEIGYHYEDWRLAGYDAARGAALFETHLERLRALAPVRTISMHGSPFAKENNMAIWNHVAYRDHGVEDCILSRDWSSFVFFTDTGRTFGPSDANLRDYLGNARTAPDVKTSAQVCAFLREGRNPLIQLSVHPERWTDREVAWATQWARDMAANTVKRALKLARGGAEQQKASA